MLKTFAENGIMMIILTFSLNNIVAAMLNVSRRWPVVVYVDSDLTMLLNNDCTRGDLTPADKWARTEPKPRLRSQAGTLLTSWNYKRFCIGLKLHPSVIKLSSLCGRVGQWPTRRLYNRSLCLLSVSVCQSVCLNVCVKRTRIVNVIM